MVIYLQKVWWFGDLGHKSVVIYIEGGDGHFGHFENFPKFDHFLMALRLYLSKKIFRESASKLFMYTWGVIGICQNDFWIISQCGGPVPTYVVNFRNEGIKWPYFVT